MSDGPHRSLNMPRAWKKLAGRADKTAYAPDSVCDALLPALERDWRQEVPDSLYRSVRRLLGDRQTVLFASQRVEQLEALRRNAAGYPLGDVFLDHAIRAAARGLSGDRALSESVEHTLRDRAVRGARQVEEHYCRKTSPDRAVHVRRRIEAAVMQTDIGALARQLIGTDDGKATQRPAKYTGLDDGVRL